MSGWTDGRIDTNEGWTRRGPRGLTILTLILGLGMHLRGAQESSSEKDGKDEKELKESVDKVHRLACRPKSSEGLGIWRGDVKCSFYC